MLWSMAIPVERRERGLGVIIRCFEFWQTTEKNSNSRFYENLWSVQCKSTKKVVLCRSFSDRYQFSIRYKTNLKKKMIKGQWLTLLIWTNLPGTYQIILPSLWLKNSKVTFSRNSLCNYHLSFSFKLMHCLYCGDQKQFNHCMRF